MSSTAFPSLLTRRTQSSDALPVSPHTVFEGYLYKRSTKDSWLKRFFKIRWVPYDDVKDIQYPERESSYNTLSRRTASNASLNERSRTTSSAKLNERPFVVNGLTLRFSYHHSSKKTSKERWGCGFEELLRVSRRGETRKQVFVVKTIRRTFELMAQDQKGMDSWISHLEKMKLFAQTQKFKGQSQALTSPFSGSNSNLRSTTASLATMNRLNSVANSVAPSVMSLQETRIRKNHMQYSSNDVLSESNSDKKLNDSFSRTNSSAGVPVIPVAELRQQKRSPQYSSSSGLTDIKEQDQSEQPSKGSNALPPQHQSLLKRLFPEKSVATAPDNAANTSPPPPTQNETQLDRIASISSQVTPENTVPRPLPINIAAAVKSTTGENSFRLPDDTDTYNVVGAYVYHSGNNSPTAGKEPSQYAARSKPDWSEVDKVLEFMNQYLEGNDNSKKPKEQGEKEIGNDIPSVQRSYKPDPKLSHPSLDRVVLKSVVSSDNIRLNRSNSNILAPFENTSPTTRSQLSPSPINRSASHSSHHHAGTTPGKHLERPSPGNSNTSLTSSGFQRSFVPDPKISHPPLGVVLQNRSPSNLSIITNASTNGTDKSLKPSLDQHSNSTAAVDPDLAPILDIFSALETPEPNFFRAQSDARDLKMSR